MTIEEATPVTAPVEPARQPERQVSGTPCLVPDLIGLDAPAAHQLARGAGIHLAVSVWETRVGPWGMVLDQRPGPGARVRRGTRVQVVVSGRPQAHIPDVTGMDLGAALEHLSWLGFVPLVGGRQRSIAIAAGHIISTRPAADTLVAEGSVVALTVSRGNRPDHDRREP